MIDFKAVAANELKRALFNCQSWLPAGKLRGHEWVVGGLDGSPGESLSINVNTGMWSDFAAGGTAKGGDMISLYAAINRISQLEAARQLGGDDAGSVAVAVAAPKAADEWRIISPVPDDAGDPHAAHPVHGVPTHVAHYRAADGALLGLVYRCEPEGARKQICSLTFQEHKSGRREWRWKSMDKPRPLYGLETISGVGRVLVVEGEPKADAARRMLTGRGVAVVSWQGGSNAVATADWSTLAGRDVVIWPDADGPGLNAAAAVTIQLRHHGATVQTVGLPDGLPGGWDLADAEREGWNGERVMAQIDPQPVALSEEYIQTSDYPDFDIGGPVAADVADFIPLGHDDGRFYFFSSGSGQVRDFTSRDLHSSSALVELARLRYWETNYPGKEGFSVKAAGDALVSMCFKAGIYDPERIRGRGAWFDEGRSVLHLGDRTIIDGVESAIVVPNSRFIYENSPRMRLDLGEPLSTVEANRLRELCAAAPWEEADHMGQLLAGWCVIAPVCGAMPWRPHLWVAGEAGSGKSWLLDNIVKPIVGQVALAVQSKTTEAGIRQTLGCDARPVLFDEAETQNDRDRERVQLIMDLARQASSEDGAAIVKGSAGGKATQYRVRSCFLFSSINVGVVQAADESRTVVLTLAVNPDAGERVTSFDRLRKLHAEVMARDFPGRLLARTLSLLPVIRENAGVFADAIARSGKSRRMGDTYGVLMAGAWSLRSRAVATAAEADAMVADTPWVVKATAKQDIEPDWKRALDALLQHRAHVRNEDIPIGELIERARFRNNDDGSWELVELERIGILVESDRIIIGNKSAGVSRIFDRTPWAGSWMPTLLRAPGAVKGAGGKPFRIAGTVTRGFSVPVG